MSEEARKIKCLIWDLDHTIWEGVLLENEDIRLREGVVDIIQELDNRGILQSISSKNDYYCAVKKLKELGIYEYFIHPQINWNAKSQSIYSIAKLLNIGMDSLAFIDDQPVERDEVSFNRPEVLCIDAGKLSDLLAMPELIPRFVNPDSRKRRLLYQGNIQRNELEHEFSGTKEEFLASLHMKLTISLADADDLIRAEELTVRSHQLNSTGYLYSYEELSAFRESKNHRLFMCELEDKYGTHGKIGLALIEINQNIWTLKLLLMSCRVMGKGVGSVLLNYLLCLAKEEKVAFHAEFVQTNYNRLMYITYKFSGFYEIAQNNNFILLGHNLENIAPIPKYIEVNIGSPPRF